MHNFPTFGYHASDRDIKEIANATNLSIADLILIPPLKFPKHYF